MLQKGNWLHYQDLILIVKLREIACKMSGIGFIFYFHFSNQEEGN